MRLLLSDEQEAARVAALSRYEHKIAAIGQLGRAADCLPVYVDWTAFLGLGKGGQCLWVDHDASPGKVEPVTELLPLSILVANLRFVPGLEGLAPRRPPGREDCIQCSGSGRVWVGNVEVGCVCGGLGWRPVSPTELGLAAS